MAARGCRLLFRDATRRLRSPRGLLRKELRIWKDLCSGASQPLEIPPAKLCGLLSVYAVGARNVAFRGVGGKQDAVDVPVLDTIRIQLYYTVARWCAALLTWQPKGASPAPPTATQAATLKALLRGQALQAYSRQLAELASAHAASDEESSAPAGRRKVGLFEGFALVEVVNAAASLLSMVSNLSKRFPPVPAAPGQLSGAAECPLAAAGCSTEAGRAAVGEEADAQAGQADSRAECREEEEEEEALPAVSGPPQEMLEVLDALGSSGVLEHVARVVVLGARWERNWLSARNVTRQAGERLGGELKQGVNVLAQKLDDLRPGVHNCVDSFNDAYHCVSRMAYCPGMLRGDSYVIRESSFTAADVPAGDAISQFLNANVVDSAAPLDAACCVLDTPRVAVLRRVLSGPCTRYLVLCLGLRTLSALDGGSTYGLPEASWLEQLLECSDTDSSGEEQPQQQSVPLHALPLLNLVMLLAVRPCGQEEADTEAGAREGAGAAGTEAEEAARARAGADPEERAGHGAGAAGVAAGVGAAAAGATESAGAGAGPDLEARAAARSADEAAEVEAGGVPSRAEGAGSSGHARAVGEEGPAGVTDEAGGAAALGEGSEREAGAAGEQRFRAMACGGLPGRATRLQLTLRVARAVALKGVQARGSAADAPGATRCHPEPGAATFVTAVQALQFAWRHMPPPPAPLGRGDGGRRRAALQDWAAAVGQVTASGIVTHAEAEAAAAFRFGQLIGLMRHALGPVSERDLPALASGGHLLRAMEALVRHVTEEGASDATAEAGKGQENGGRGAAAAAGGPGSEEQQRTPGPAQAPALAPSTAASSSPAPCSSSARPAGAPEQAPSPAAFALQALVRAVCGGPECVSCPFRDLLLLRGDDEELGAGDGEGGGSGGSHGTESGTAVGVCQGRAGPRAAASVAVAVGKLLWRCQGRLVDELRSLEDCDVRCHEEGAVVALYGVQFVLVSGAWDTPFACMDRRCGTSGQAHGGRRLDLGAAGGVNVGEGTAGGGMEAGTGAAGPSAGILLIGNDVQQLEQWLGLRERWQQLGRQAQQERRLRVWVLAYCAWRWVPGLAGVARRMAEGGFRPEDWDTVGWLVWEPLLYWVNLLCCRHLLSAEAEELGGEQRPNGGGANESSTCSGVRGGAGGSSSSSNNSSSWDGGKQPAVQGFDGGLGIGGEAGTVAGAGTGGQNTNAVVCVNSCGSAGCGSEGGVGRRCGCWRDFLLREVGAVELVGLALRVVVPALLQQQQLEGEEGAMAKDVPRFVLEVCVALAAVCPEEVARVAWGPVRGEAAAPGGNSPGDDGGKGGDGGGCAKGPGEGGGGVAGSVAGTRMWPLATLAALADRIGDAHEAMHQALRVLVEWGTECERQGRPVGAGEAQRRVLAQVAERFLNGVEEDTVLLDVLLMPPLCQLRSALRTCSNPRCVVLPPPGQTEAEAAAEAGGRMEACPGGCGAAWYCCQECRAEHWREGHGQVCCARTEQQLKQV